MKIDVQTYSPVAVKQVLAAETVTITLSRAAAYALMAVSGDVSPNERDEMANKLFNSKNDVINKSSIYLPEWIKENAPPSKLDFIYGYKELFGCYFDLQRLLQPKE